MSGYSKNIYTTMGSRVSRLFSLQKGPNVSISPHDHSGIRGVSLNKNTHIILSKNPFLRGRNNVGNFYYKRFL